MMWSPICLNCFENGSYCSNVVKSRRGSADSNKWRIFRRNKGKKRVDIMRIYW